MSGGRSPRTKGFRFEREIVALALKAGLQAKRLWGSNGSTQGLPEGVDVIISAGRQWCFQAKRYRQIADYLQRPEGTHGVIVREDGGEPLIILPLAAFLELVRGVGYNGSEHDSAQQRTLQEIHETQNLTRQRDKGD